MRNTTRTSTKGAGIPWDQEIKMLEKLPLEVKKLLWEAEVSFSPTQVFKLLFYKGWSVDKLKQQLAKRTREIRLAAYGPDIYKGLPE